MHITNQLLFIDDLKLLAESDEELQWKMNETKFFFAAIWLEMDKPKSATNSKGCEPDATLLEGKASYEYMWIIVTADSTIASDLF